MGHFYLVFFFFLDGNGTTARQPENAPLSGVVEGRNHSKWGISMAMAMAVALCLFHIQVL